MGHRAASREQSNAPRVSRAAEGGIQQSNRLRQCPDLDMTTSAEKRRSAYCPADLHTALHRHNVTCELICRPGLPTSSLLP